MYGPIALIVTAVVFPLLAAMAVCLRFYVRLRLKPTFVGIDDLMIAFSCLLVCAAGADQIVGATIGSLGRENDPAALMDPRRIYVQSKCNYAVLITEKVIYSCIKIGVLLFYRRIFITPTFRRVNDILIVAIAIWGVIFLLSETFLCGSTSRGGSPCASSEWRALWFAITDVLTDIAVLAMPYPMIKKLHMDKKEKIGLVGIFLLGALSVIAGVIRTGFVADRFHAYFRPSNDHSVDAAPYFWTTFEISIGVLAACLPPLGPLIRRIPSPSKLYDTIKVSIGLCSRTTQSREEIMGSRRVSKAGWINLEARNKSETRSGGEVDKYKGIQGTRDSLEV